MKNFCKFILALFICSAIVSCKNYEGFTVSGDIKNGEGIKVYLEDIGDTTPVVIDTAVVRKGTFIMKNYADKGVYRLRFGENTRSSVFLFIRDKDNIKVTADIQQLKKYSVTGSKPSADIKQLMDKTRDEYDLLDSSFARVKNATATTKDSTMAIFNSHKETLVHLIKDFVDKEKDPEVACFALNLLGPMKEEEISYLVDISEKLHEADPKSKYINSWNQSIQQYSEKVMDQEEGGIALGDNAPDIALLSPSGDTIQLKNLMGNYVLLDFWASWCGPCRQENPNVVKLYNKYHSLGFEIFSVSLDADKQQWVSAINKDGLSWKNHGCDFSGWHSPAALMYNIKAIPATFLLDKKGKVIAKNLRGEDLDRKLSELLPLNKSNN